MFYIKIHVLEPPPESEGYMELFNGFLQRLTDLSGMEIFPISYNVSDANPAQPTWALPDPPPPPEPPLPVPDQVSRAQFITQLIRSGMISEADGLQAASVGTVPSIIAGLFAQLPETQQLEAKVAWATVAEIQRNSGIIQSLLAAQALTGDDVDNLFRAAGQITF